MTELPDLEVHDQKGLQTAVEEDEIDAELIVVDAEPALATHKRKIITQLQ
jgi:hypothetical protein